MLAKRNLNICEYCMPCSRIKSSNFQQKNSLIKPEISRFKMFSRNKIWTQFDFLHELNEGRETKWMNTAPCSRFASETSRPNKPSPNRKKRRAKRKRGDANADSQGNANLFAEGWHLHTHIQNSEQWLSGIITIANFSRFALQKVVKINFNSEFKKEFWKSSCVVQVG